MVFLIRLIELILSLTAFILRPIRPILGRIFCVKISDGEWEKIKDAECFHITESRHLRNIQQSNGNVHLKKSEKIGSNIIAPRPSVYLFQGKPNDRDINLLKQQNRDSAVVIRISDIPRENLFRRRIDGALLITSDYIGPGRIEDWPK